MFSASSSVDRSEFPRARSAPTSERLNHDRSRHHPHRPRAPPPKPHPNLRLRPHSVGRRGHPACRWCDSGDLGSNGSRCRRPPPLLLSATRYLTTVGGRAFAVGSSLKLTVG